MICEKTPFRGKLSFIYKKNLPAYSVWLFPRFHDLLLKAIMRFPIGKYLHFFIKAS